MARNTLGGFDDYLFVDIAETRMEHYQLLGGLFEAVDERSCGRKAGAGEGEGEGVGRGGGEESKQK